MTEIVLLILAVAFFARRGRGKGGGRDTLPAVLAGAESAGIITTAERERLLAYAATFEPAGGRLGGAAWLGVFAGLFVVAGVSLLIARNWEDIGPLVRIGVFALALLAAGEGAIRARERTVAVSVPLELVWFFLPLLGIGLYGQTFHLSGDPVQPFLVWLALSIPLAWASPRPVVASLHTFAIVGVLFVGNFVVDTASSLFWSGANGPTGMLTLRADGGTPLAWMLSLVLLGIVSAQSLRLLPRAHRHHFVGVWVVWVWGLILAPTPIRLRHEGWIILAAVALTTLWIIVLAYMETSFEERAASLVAWLATLYALTFTWHMDRAATGSTNPAGLAVVELVVVTALGAVLALPLRRLSPVPSWAWLAKTALIAPVLVAMLYLTGDVRQVWQAAVGMNVILVVVAVGLMWHGSLLRDVAQINLGVLVLVGMLITRFLDVFGNMLRSGIGFIIAGVLLAVLSLALERTRRRLIGTSSTAATQ
jgi:uncharacterized membrane protein